MDQKVLENAGLTGNESIVYLALLKRGSSPAGSLVKETGLHRSRIYESLESLAQKGLVGSFVKEFTRHFQAAKPEILLAFLDEKKRQIDDDKREVEKILPELKRMESMKKEEIDGVVLKGKEGLKTIHNEMLKQEGDIMVLGAKGLIFSEISHFIEAFERDRINRGQKWLSIYDSRENFSRVSVPLSEKRLLPEGFRSDGVVNIFGDKVAIVLWREKYPTGFMITNWRIAEAFRIWFRFIWARCEGGRGQ
jgi:sugar-specific transcriptional regulator TrmB